MTSDTRSLVAADALLPVLAVAATGDVSAILTVSRGEYDARPNGRGMDVLEEQTASRVFHSTLPSLTAVHLRHPTRWIRNSGLGLQRLFQGHETLRVQPAGSGYGG